MPEGKSSISSASSYEEIGAYWDEHDITEVWDQTEPAEFEVNLGREKRYFALDALLTHQLSVIAEKRGVAPGRLPLLPPADQTTTNRRLVTTI